MTFVERSLKERLDGLLLSLGRLKWVMQHEPSKITHAIECVFVEFWRENTVEGQEANKKAAASATPRYPWEGGRSWD